MPTLKWWNGSQWVAKGLRNPEGSPLGSVWGDHDVKWWDGAQWVTIYSAQPPILSTGEVLPSSYYEEIGGGGGGSGTDAPWSNPGNLLTVANSASVRFETDGLISNTLQLLDWGFDTLIGDKVGTHHLEDIIVRVYRGDTDETGFDMELYAETPDFKSLASDNITINSTPEVLDKARYNETNDFLLENVADASFAIDIVLQYDDTLHTFGTRTFTHITVEVLYQEN